MTDDSQPKAGWTRAQVRAWALLRLAGVSDTPDLDADLLIEHATGIQRIYWLIDHGQVVDAKQLEAISKVIYRRIDKEPVAYILGHQEFWSLKFKVSPATLIPRADSEAIVSLALDELGADTPKRVLDLGTGTGCLLLSLLHEWGQALGVGVDLADSAVELARSNANDLGLAGRTQFYSGDWFNGLPGATEKFDLIVSNPPYIETNVVQELMPDVRCFEPGRALDGGMDGLDCYKTITQGAVNWLNIGGFLLFELGAGQRDDVAAIMEANGFTVTAERKDLGGHTRALMGRLRHTEAVE